MVEILTKFFGNFESTKKEEHILEMPGLKVSYDY